MKPVEPFAVFIENFKYNWRQLIIGRHAANLDPTPCTHNICAHKLTCVYKGSERV